MLVVMAGGMVGRPGPTMAERVGARPVRTPPDATHHLTAGQQLKDTDRPVGQRHCWVSGPPEDPAGRHAALVVAWRSDGDGRWSARTVYVLDRAGGAVVVEAWLDAGLLIPT